MQVVIVGGTSGIGLATAHRLIRDGYEVTVLGRDEKKLADAKAHFTGVARLDATDPEATAEFFGGFGPFEHLVLSLSGGRLGGGPLRDTPLDKIRASFEGKLFPYLSVIQHADVTSSITVVTAASARSARSGSVMAAAVNGAIERVVPPLASELAPVRVNAVSPGAVDTPWWDFLSPDAKAENFAHLAATLPVGRVGEATDIAAAIAYLIDASFVTGSILAVDGGFTVP